MCLRSLLRSGLKLSETRFTDEKTDDQVIDEVMFSDPDDDEIELDVSMFGE